MRKTYKITSPEQRHTQDMSLCHHVCVNEVEVSFRVGEVYEVGEKFHSHYGFHLQLTCISQLCNSYLIPQTVPGAATYLGLHNIYLDN